MAKLKRRRKGRVARGRILRGVRLVATPEFSPDDSNPRVYGLLAVEPSWIQFLDMWDWQEDLPGSVYLVVNGGTYEICGDRDEIEQLKEMCIAAGLKDNRDGTYGTRPEDDLTGS